MEPKKVSYNRACEITLDQYIVEAGLFVSPMLKQSKIFNEFDVQMNDVTIKTENDENASEILDLREIINKKQTGNNKLSTNNCNPGIFNNSNSLINKSTTAHIPPLLNFSDYFFKNNNSKTRNRGGPSRRRKLNKQKKLDLQQKQFGNCIKRDNNINTNNKRNLDLDVAHDLRIEVPAASVGQQTNNNNKSNGKGSKNPQNNNSSEFQNNMKHQCSTNGNSLILDDLATKIIEKFRSEQYASTEKYDLKLQREIQIIQKKTDLTDCVLTPATTARSLNNRFA